MLKKLLILIGIFNVIITKSILIAKSINSEKCDYDLGRYFFNINAVLNGNLSKSILENYTIENSNINNLKIICKFPEVKIPVKNKNIEINCYTDNILLYNNLSLNFKGINNDLDLINIENIFCKKNIKLLLGNIKEQKCKHLNLYFYYEYKIDIENKTIPYNLDIYNIDLKPNIINENIYNISCDLVNNDNNNYFNCALFSRKQIDYLFYEKYFIYKKEINNNIIIIQNIKNNLYVGKNIKCVSDINNYSGLKLRAMEDKGSDAPEEEVEDTSISSHNTEEDISTNINEPTNSTCEKNCKNCNNVGICSECNKGYYLDNQKCFKCFPTCEACDSNTCTTCKNGFIKNGITCISCFEKFSGCKNCSESQCLNCYTELNYKMNSNNNLCENGKSNNLNNLNYDNKLEFKRFDSFEKANNKIFFKSHFILLKNYLSKTNLIINGNIIYNNILLRFLRKLTSPEQIYCEQYGVSLGNSNNGGYLANYICSKEMTTNEIV